MFNIKIKKSFQRRKNRVRSNLDLKKYPRLSVYRTNNNIYAQLIDDINNCTLASASTVELSFKEKFNFGGDIKSAEIIGKLIAQRSTKLGVKKIIFDRGGYLYHGRIKALADYARKYYLVF